MSVNETETPTRLPDQLPQSLVIFSESLDDITLSRGDSMTDSEIEMCGVDADADATWWATAWRRLLGQQKRPSEPLASSARTKAGKDTASLEPCTSDSSDSANMYPLPLRMVAPPPEPMEEAPTIDSTKKKSRDRQRLTLCVVITTILSLSLTIGLVVFATTKRGTSKAKQQYPASSTAACPSALPSTAACTSETPSLSPMDSFQPPTLRSAANPTSFDDSLPPSKPVNITYYPGLINKYENGLMLSQGLTAKVLALTGTRVMYASGEVSDEFVHTAPDFGATYPDQRSGNEGGWVYVSNSENRTKGKGGVAAFTFNKDGDVIDYRMVLRNTTANCGGGKTPWNAWISCEETKNGLIYQVDPFGKKKSQLITMGQETNGGNFESFAYYIKNKSAPEFYVTEDDKDGVVRRFIPKKPDWSDPWSILLGDGEVDYLLLDESEMTFRWTSDVEAARENAALYFPYTEGIDRYEDKLYFIAKKLRSMFILDLQAGTYFNVTTQNGAFDGQPDQIVRILDDTPDDFEQQEYIFFVEDGGKRPGIFARNKDGEFYTILETINYPKDEPTGLAFSPDGKHLYFALQDIGLMYDITREDGLGFQGKSVNVNYHSPDPDE